MPHILRNTKSYTTKLNYDEYFEKCYTYPPHMVVKTKEGEEKFQTMTSAEQYKCATEAVDL